MQVIKLRRPKALLLALLCSALPALGNVQDYDGGTAEGAEPFGPAAHGDYFQYEACKLLVADDVPFPFGRFEVSLGSRYGGRGWGWGFASLHPRLIAPRAYPVPEAIINRRREGKETWNDQITVLMEDVGWTPLSYAHAERLWGKPRKQQDYYTFDAKNNHHGEENIFHLDLSFDDNLDLKAYRIRGIRITSPIWIGPKTGSSGPIEIIAPGDSPRYKPEAPEVERIPIRCGNDEANLEIRISGVRGELQLASAPVENKFDDSHKWFDSCCVKKVRSSDGTVTFEKPTIADLQRWWGTPHTAGDPAGTFDIHCKHNGESEIFHADIRVDDKLNIVSCGTRGPGIGVVGIFR